MVTSPTCPRGHALEPNAVLCTVCWVRVEPVDPAVEAARRRRRRRVWFPLVGAGAIVVGVVAGGSVGVLGHQPSPPSVAAAEPIPTSSAAPTPTPEAVAVEPVVVTPEAVAAQPLAATVADWSQDVCAPKGTETLRVSTRPDAQSEWTPVEATEIPGSSTTCSEGQESVTVDVLTVPDTAIAIRIEYLDDSDALIDKARFSLS